MKAVAVAMSGGLDSSVTAAVLKQKGFHVIGVTLRLFDCEIATAADSRSCCSRQDVIDAMKVASALKIEHRVLDLSEVFREKVLKPFVDSYVCGNTPNPCIDCNRYIKFETLLCWALKQGADLLATGHHARIVQPGNSNEFFSLRKALDKQKDQSYFLYVASQKVLPKLLFPMGNILKNRARQIAKDLGLPVAEKWESQEICFAAGKHYSSFLARFGNIEETPGDILLTSGKKIGQHKGLHYYTIGQRRGLGVAVGKPLYVVRKDLTTNTLIVGSREELLCKGLTAKQVVWTGGRIAKVGQTLDVKFRYRTPPIPARIIKAERESFFVEFLAPAYAIATGQSAVLYKKDEVIGGGIISDTLTQHGGAQT